MRIEPYWIQGLEIGFILNNKDKVIDIDLLIFGISIYWGKEQ